MKGRSCRPGGRPRSSWPRSRPRGPQSQFVRRVMQRRNVMPYAYASLWMIFDRSTDQLICRRLRRTGDLYHIVLPASTWKAEFESLTDQATKLNSSIKFPVEL